MKQKRFQERNPILTRVLVQSHATIAGAEACLTAVVEIEEELETDLDRETAPAIRRCPLLLECAAKERKILFGTVAPVDRATTCRRVASCCQFSRPWH